MFIVELIISVHTDSTYWQVRASNGRVLLKSDTYTTQYPARRAAKSFQKKLNNSTYREDKRWL